jgi:hypothetical protein
MRRILLLALGLALCISVGARDRVLFEKDEIVQTASIKSLPASVQHLLGVGVAGLDGIADAGETFNVSDLVDDRFPMRRYVAGGFGRTSALVQIEVGGRSHYYQLLVIEQADGDWKIRRRWVLDKSMRSLTSMAAYADGCEKANKPMQPTCEDARG